MLRHGGCHGQDNILQRALIKGIGTRQHRAAGALVAALLSVTVNLRLHGEHRWQAGAEGGGAGRGLPPL